MTHQEEHTRRIRLLGRRVRVTLDESVVVEGVLLAYADGGDFEIKCDDGMVHYCWPMLDIEEAL